MIAVDFNGSNNLSFDILFVIFEFFASLVRSHGISNPRQVPLVS